MLKMISWMTFLTASFFCSLCYYSVFLARYYKREIVAFLTKKSKGAGSTQGQRPVNVKQAGLYAAMEKAMAALTESLRMLNAEGVDRQVVVAACRKILAQYGYLKDTPYAIAIYHFLLRETNQAVRLNEEEVKSLWE